MRWTCESIIVTVTMVTDIPAVDDRTGDDGNELLDGFLFNAGLVLIGFTIVCNDDTTIINVSCIKVCEMVTIIRDTFVWRFSCRYIHEALKQLASKTKCLGEL